MHPVFASFQRTWQYDQEGDPYPSWVISNAGLLKIAIPQVLKKYIPAAHSEQVLAILEQRAGVLRRLGLKAAFACFDPSMLPEAVFTDHPLWRGARRSPGSVARGALGAGHRSSGGAGVV